LARLLLWWWYGQQVLTKVDPTQFIPPAYCKTSATLHRSCGPDAAQVLAAL
jgi:hypothetical protein